MIKDLCILNLGSFLYRSVILASICILKRRDVFISMIYF